MQASTEQQEAILHFRGPAIVIAGPGSGKTRVITARAAHLIEGCRVPPSQILVVTFTRAAAEEMRGRFARLSVPGGAKVSFGTFHSLFYRILKEGNQLNIRGVVTEEQKLRWLDEWCAALKTEALTERDERLEVLRAFSAVKGQEADRASFELPGCPKELFDRLFREYEERLRQEKLLDFEDMQLRCARLLENKPDVLAAWQRRFPFLMADEFQDISPIQYRILRMLAKERNLFAVGDDDQSIYRFRGAGPRIMLRFPADFPETARYTLGTCYRCSPEILGAADRVIRCNRERYRKKLTAAGAHGPKPVIARLEDAGAEDRFLLSEIRRLHAEGVPYEEMAVLYRTTFLARSLTSALIRAGIPYDAPDRIPDPHDHFTAADTFAYLRLAAGSGKRADLLTVLNKPNRFLSRASVGDGPDLLPSMAAYYRNQAWALERISRLAADLRILARLRPFAAVEYIRREMGYEDYLREYAFATGQSYEEWKERMDALQEESIPFETAAEWEEAVLKERETRRRLEKEPAPGVRISTIHRAKGLEFDAVFLPELNEGVLPHERSKEAEALEEERRLFYVGMTRARKYLTVTYTAKRRARPGEPSRFLKEMSGRTGSGTVDFRMKGEE